MLVLSLISHAILEVRARRSGTQRSEQEGSLVVGEQASQDRALAQA